MMGSLQQTLTINGIDFSKAEGLVGKGFVFSNPNQRWTKIIGRGGAGLRSENQNWRTGEFTISVLVNSKLYNTLLTLFQTGNTFSIQQKNQLAELNVSTVANFNDCFIQKAGEQYEMTGSTVDDAVYTIDFKGEAFEINYINS